MRPVDVPATPIRIPVPFVRRDIGAGDLAKAALDAVGKHQKQGCRCKRIQGFLNRKFTVVPVNGKS